MEDTTLLQILEVQTEILSELRLLRQALAPQQPETTATPQPAPAAAATPPAPAAETPLAPVTPTAPLHPVAPQPAQPVQPVQQPQPMPPVQPTQPPASSGTMLTVNELTDLGGQFLDPGQMHRAKVKPVEASDLLNDIKAKNKAKRSAFAEFDKFGKGR